MIENGIAITRNRVYKPHTEESKKKISDGLRGRPANSGSFKKGHGKGEIRGPLSQSTKDKLSKEIKRKYACGEIVPARAMLGVITSDETKKKISVASKGRVSGMKGKKHSKETIDKMRSRRGDKSYNWKGGRIKLTTMIRGCLKYNEWRSAVFIRDNFSCQRCGVNKVYLNAHHLIPFSEILDKNKIISMSNAYNCDELWDINNGITLCKRCHYKEHFS